MLPRKTTSLPVAKPLMSFHDTELRIGTDSKCESHSLELFCTRSREFTKAQQLAGTQSTSPISKALKILAFH